MPGNTSSSPTLARSDHDLRMMSQPTRAGGTRRTAVSTERVGREAPHPSARLSHQPRSRPPNPDRNNLKEIPDRELEHAVFFIRQGLEREAPLETQGPERREPADAEADGRAQIRQAREAVEARADGAVLNGATAGFAVVALQIPSVASVGEKHAAHAHRFHDRKLQLQVLEVLQVAADLGALINRGAVRIGRARQPDARTD